MKMTNKIMLGVGLVAVWAVAYVGIWIKLYGSTKSPLTAFGEWLEQLVMLNWVEGYQTLIAGAAAAVGGLVVFYTYRMQRRDALADRHAEFEAAVARLSVQFRAAAFTAITSRDPDKSEAMLVGLETALLSVTHRSPRVAMRLQILIAFAKLRTRTLRDADENEKAKIGYGVAAYSMTASEMCQRRLPHDDSSIPMEVDDDFRHNVRWDELPTQDRDNLDGWLLFEVK